MEQEKKCKSVFSPAIARKLIKEGFKLVDIKPSRENPSRTVFIFEESPEFISKFTEYASYKKNVDTSQFGVELGVS